MTKVRVNEESGRVLDYLVSIAVGDAYHAHSILTRPKSYMCRYHASWKHAGPLIEQEFIRLKPDAPYWQADSYSDAGEHFMGVGFTPLVAAMHCYVTSKLGAEVEIEDGILKLLRADHG